MRNLLAVVVLLCTVVLSACTIQPITPTQEVSVRIDFGEGFVPTEISDMQAVVQIKCGDGKLIERTSMAKARSIGDDECSGLAGPGVEIAVAGYGIMMTPNTDSEDCEGLFVKVGDDSPVEDLQVMFWAVVIPPPCELVFDFG